MDAKEVRERFLKYFERQGHTVVLPSSLIPDDPSVLLTTAGMQQFKKYYTGEADPLTTVHPNLGKPLGAKSAASIQKSFRTSDIDEVGDTTHLTLFEMVGNFSFGGYFKKEAITYAYEFITKELGLPISYVTIFKGSEVVPKDEESRAIWNELGVSDVREEGMEDVFWGPTGNEGPCGPTTEVYCKNASGKDVEIWNIVFNQYFYPGSREELLAGASGKQLKPLETPGVDTGMGLERLLMIVQNKGNIFETDLFQPIIELLPNEMDDRVKRIMADHLRAMTFLICDGVRPSNKEAGYVLRRLMRRVIVHGKRANLSEGDMERLIGAVALHYGYFYPELEADVVAEVFEEEYEKFEKTLDKGLREMAKLEKIGAVEAFNLFQTFGLPFEIVKELGGDKAGELSRKNFEEEFEKHQHKSRAGQEKKFGGHGLLLDTGELKAKDEEELKIVTRLHTATHMLQRALREVLGPEVTQAGSDITVERTRFDFTFPRKLTDDEKKKVEDLVNQKIKEDLPMQKVVLPRAEAEKTGALYFFKEKYPDPVNVYFIGKDLESAWSKEFCGGPHVTHTGEIGEFHLAKEEAVSSGVRRIRGVVK
ncbi:MAG: hypothetical protein KGZ30_00485 [Anaplasmataceae bacterium]|nr:hypothetical protein [Anaplasmataceae bacterium]